RGGARRGAWKLLRRDRFRGRRRELGAGAAAAGAHDAGGSTVEDADLLLSSSERLRSVAVPHARVSDEARRQEIRDEDLSRVRQVGPGGTRLRLFRIAGVGRRRVPFSRQVLRTMIASELRPAARTLAGSPRTTLVSVLLLALGLGANTVLFALGDAVMFRPFPFTDQDRLVIAAEHVTSTRAEVSYANV